ncbi:MAG: hypothetical protein HS100_19245 [Anaerolineales bacterium]|nr:MAG: hypothetical protein EDM79_04470 [Chloroflexota bacterium]MBE7436060.1 hypothetical protein [Anaerolineales bacterium]GJQ34831.1 MAG: hypothetical protein JETCAE01_08410 [Anaerolineaceae bacterium]
MTLDETIQIGDRVQIQLNEKFGEHMGWYDGVVMRIEPYSSNRSFYWVLLNAEAQSVLKVREISVLNPRNIRKVE